MDEEDYEGYHDDFSEGEAAPNEEEEETQHDNDDEQYAQKINGRIERLQRRVEDLEHELNMERQSSMDIRKKFELDLAQLRAEVAESQQNNNFSSNNEQNTVTAANAAMDAQAEVLKYKKKCEMLQEKYELLMLTGSGAGSGVPLLLEQELHTLCNKHNIFHELHDKTLSITDAVSIVKALGSKKRSAPSQSAQEHQQGPGTAPQPLQLQDRIKQLERELRGVTSSARDDVQHLKDKVFHLSERVRVEKEHKRFAEQDAEQAKKKVAMLSEHIEKLMLHLKRESVHKLRLSEQLRAAEKERVASQERFDLLSKKMVAKDRLLYELREGSKVLDDQLRLMDEKYLELRGKLDWARETAHKRIRTAEKTASDLRAKFVMAGGSQLLDNVSLPSQEDMLVGPWVSSKTRGIATPGDRSMPMSRLGALPTPMDVSTTSLRSEPSLDGVLEKIRKQQGIRQDWTPDKLQKLTQTR
jgi:hypothetical protein